MSLQLCKRTLKLIWKLKSKTNKATFSWAWIKGVKKQTLFCYLPIAVLKDVCTCQLHVILSHRRHGLHFVQTVQWPPTQIVKFWYDNNSLLPSVHSRICSLLWYSKFGTLRKFLCSTFSIDKRIPFHSLALNFIILSHRFQFFTMWRKRLNTQSRQIRKFCRGKLWLKSDAQLKDRIVFTFKRFSI